jgi:hypothetical protein
MRLRNVVLSILALAPIQSISFAAQVAQGKEKNVKEEKPKAEPKQ